MFKFITNFFKEKKLEEKQKKDFQMCLINRTIKVFEYVDDLIIETKENGKSIRKCTVCGVVQYFDTTPIIEMHHKEDCPCDNINLLLLDARTRRKLLIFHD